MSDNILKKNIIDLKKYKKIIKMAKAYESINDTRKSQHYYSKAEALLRGEDVYFEEDL